MNHSILHHYSLKSYNTFGVDINADYFTEVNSISDLHQIIETKELSELPKFILGGGSNILFTKDFNGLVIKNSLKGIQMSEDTRESVYISANSGELWQDLLTFCVTNGYYGIENLTMIPGTVGAAPIQNIGAYGSELKDHFESLEAIDLKTGETKVFNYNDCQFSYRNSVFKNELKGKYFISAITLKLYTQPKFNISYKELEDALKKSGSNKYTLELISDTIANIRKNKLPDPKLVGNAGSFFKNPVVSLKKYEELKKSFNDLKGFSLDEDNYKISAAWLIEKTGWKGKLVGNVGCYHSQPLVIVNYGNATGQEILEFANQVKEAIKNSFDINLEFEVNLQ